MTLPTHLSPHSCPMTYSLTQLKPDDLALAQELIQAWNLDEGGEKGKLPRAPYLKSLLKKDDFYVSVALVEGKVVGGLTGYELPMFDREVREMFLYEIGVIAAFRQHGIARALIEALKAYCHQRGITVIFVGTSLDNDAARKLYESTGGELEVIPWFTYELGEKGKQ